MGMASESLKHSSATIEEGSHGVQVRPGHRGAVMLEWGSERGFRLRLLVEWEWVGKGKGGERRLQGPW